MILGGSPVQGVCTMTSTSEMSGSASREMWLIDQSLAARTSTVAVNTRKRFRVAPLDQSRDHLHASRGTDRELPTGEDLAVPSGEDRDLPGASAGKHRLPILNAR